MKQERAELSEPYRRIELVTREEILQAMTSTDVTDHQAVILPGGEHIVFGIPTEASQKEPGKLKLLATRTPYIYRVHFLAIPEIGTDDPVGLRDLIMMNAHGHRIDNVWKFWDGQDVVDVTVAANRSLSQLSIPRIGIVASCNGEKDEKAAEKTELLKEAGVIFSPAGDVDIFTSGDGRGLVLRVLSPHGFENVDRTYKKQNPVSSLFRGVRRHIMQ